MRHRIHHRKLNRTAEHRKALRRNLAQSLFEHGRLTTTVPKAKDLRPFVERLVALAVKVRVRRDGGDPAGSLRARRQLHKLLTDRSMIPVAHREDYALMSDAARQKTVRMASGRRYRTGQPKGRLAFTGESVTHRLVETIASRFEDRSGGYTRIVQLATRRIGDSSRLAMLQLIGNEESPGAITKPAKTARKKRADARYAFAIASLKGKGKAALAAKPPAAAGGGPSSDETEGAGNEQ